VDELAIRCARAVDAGGVEKGPALLLDDRDGAFELDCHSQLEGGRLVDLVAEPESRLAPLSHGGGSRKHIFGEGNMLADLASRTRFAKLIAAYRALGMRATRVCLPSEALEFIARVLKRLNIGWKVVTGRVDDAAPSEERACLCLRCLRARNPEEVGLGCCPCNPYGNSASHATSSSSSRRPIAASLRGCNPAAASRAQPLPSLASGAASAAAPRLQQSAGASNRCSLRRASAAAEAAATLGGVRSSGRISTARIPTQAGATTLGGAARRTNEPTRAAKLSVEPTAPGGVTQSTRRPTRGGRLCVEASAMRAAASLASERAHLHQQAVTAQSRFAIRAEPVPPAAATRAPYQSASLAATARAAAQSASDVRRATTSKLQERASRAKRGSVQRQYHELRLDERERRVQHLTEVLSSSESEYALHFKDEAELTSAVAEFVAALDEQHADGTIINEASNMRHWMAFCEHYQTAVIRRREWTEGDAVHEEELFAVAQAFFFIYARMQPRNGYSTPPRPASAINVLRGIRRMHLRLGLQFVSLTQVVAIANSVTSTYVQQLGGPQALSPRRAEPMRNNEIAGLLAIESGGHRAQRLDVHRGVSFRPQLQGAQRPARPNRIPRIRGLALVRQNLQLGVHQPSVYRVAHRRSRLHLAERKATALDERRRLRAHRSATIQVRPLRHRMGLRPHLLGLASVETDLRGASTHGTRAGVPLRARRP
jgi:hypothetical protein